MNTQTQEELKIGDKVNVKNHTYGYYVIKAFHPKGYGDKKCRMVELRHFAFGYDDIVSKIVLHRLIDISKKS